jgi:adenylate cyclase class 2
MENREIEVKFLEIDKPTLIEKLKSLNAQDLGEDFLKQEIFHDQQRKWKTENKFVRIRRTSKGSFVTFKHVEERTALGTVEIEFETSVPEKMRDFFEAIGLVMDHESEKIRHKFKLGEVIVDIDTFPKVPTYVELEGPSEEAIKEAAKILEFDWSKAVFGTASIVIEEVYKIPVKDLRFFTFDKIE